MKPLYWPAPKACSTSGGSTPQDITINRVKSGDSVQLNYGQGTVDYLTEGTYTADPCDLAAVSTELAGGVPGVYFDADGKNPVSFVCGKAVPFQDCKTQIVVCGQDDPSVDLPAFNDALQCLEDAGGGTLVVENTVDLGQPAGTITIDFPFELTAKNFGQLKNAGRLVFTKPQSGATIPVPDSVECTTPPWTQLFPAGEFFYLKGTNDISGQYHSGFAQTGGSFLTALPGGVYRSMANYNGQTVLDYHLASDFQGAEAVVLDMCDGLRIHDIELVNTVIFLQFQANFRIDNVNMSVIGVPQYPTDAYIRADFSHTGYCNNVIMDSTDSSFVTTLDRTQGYVAARVTNWIIDKPIYHGWDHGFITAGQTMGAPTSREGEPMHVTVSSGHFHIYPKSDTQGGAAALDTHAEGYRIRFVGNRVSGSGHVGSGTTAHRVPVTYSRIRARFTQVIDNEFIGESDHTSVNATGITTTEAGFCTIKDNIFRCMGVGITFDDSFGGTTASANEFIDTVHKHVRITSDSVNRNVITKNQFNEITGAGNLGSPNGHIVNDSANVALYEIHNNEFYDGSVPSILNQGTATLNACRNLFSGYGTGVTGSIGAVNLQDNCTDFVTCVSLPNGIYNLFPNAGSIPPSGTIQFNGNEPAGYVNGQVVTFANIPGGWAGTWTITSGAGTGTWVITPVPPTVIPNTGIAPTTFDIC